jgi:Fur family transcriptional regulator, ferric uptake regulator
VGTAVDHAEQAAEATGLLRSVGQRVTQPRVAVLAHILAAGEDHLSAEDVLALVSEHDDGVHRATVYRTLDGLVTAGLLRHVHLDRGLTAYHLVKAPRPDGRHHLHAQCSSCGRVVDLPANVLGDTATRVRSASGFELDASHVALSGRCADCVSLAEATPGEDT